ncbi:MAG: rRNA pseudouridine synthase [Bacilli bacterium]|nr:rRNA pseudouridine synthase [Bacilli bacterium]
MVRLQKAIADYGYCSRRKAEELITGGKVYVNGEKVTILGTKVNPNDEIRIGDEILSRQEKEYYVFNKPREVVSTVKDDKGRKTILDYFDVETRIYPIGRLDYDTTGIILLTNDGEFANTMMKPNSNIKKVYVAKINGIMPKEDLIELKNGIMIDNYKCVPDKVRVKSIDKKTNTSFIEITIHEGKNHEIKKMFEHFNLDVLKLTRISYGSINLGNLMSGKYRKLSIKEVKTLYSLVKK